LRRLKANERTNTRIKKEGEDLRLTKRREQKQQRPHNHIRAILLIDGAEGAQHEAQALPEGAHHDDPAEILFPQSQSVHVMRAGVVEGGDNRDGQAFARMNICTRWTSVVSPKAMARVRFHSQLG
jgi:hypothetical protein